MGEICKQLKYSEEYSNDDSKIQGAVGAHWINWIGIKIILGFREHLLEEVTLELSLEGHVGDSQMKKYFKPYYH